MLSAVSRIFLTLCLVQIALANEPGAAGRSEGPQFQQTKSDVPDRRVALLQSVLADKKLYPCMVDGLFGARTTSAVKSFQDMQGLKVDGIVGTETGKALGLPFWDTHLMRRLDTPFRDAKYPQGNEFNFRSLTETGNFFSGQSDADYSSANSLTRRALRTNNPGAINISKWQRDSMKGYVGTTRPGPDGNVTAIYETPEQGVAAWGFLIRKIYFNGKKDKVTLGEIVDKYRGTNSRAPYIDGYKKYSDGKLTEDYEIDLYDNRELARLAIAAYSHELGFWYPLTDKQLLKGFAITDSYIDSGVTDEVTVSPDEFDPGLYLKQPDAEKSVRGNCRTQAKTTEADVQRGLEQLVEAEGGPPGVIATLYSDGRMSVLQAGRADVERSGAPGVDDYMRIASVSKAFNGAVALHLVSQGRLNLDDTIGQRLPSLPSAWSAITVRQMLNHTSGLPDYLHAEAFIRDVTRDPRRHVLPDAIIGWVRDEPLAFAPGSRYAYSNTDNIVIGLIAEAVTGTPYGTLLKEIIFDPAGLSRTSFPTQSLDLPSPFIHGYAVTPGSAPQDVTGFISPSGAWASGAIVSTPRDLAAFIRADLALTFFGAAEQQQQMQFLSGESSPPGPGANAAGLGLFRYTTPCGVVYGHTGNFPGYTQWAAASADGTRSVTITLNIAAPTGELLERLREVQGQAVCVLLNR